MTGILSIRELALRLLSSLWQRRYLVAIPILVMPLIGLAVGTITPRHYTARMTLLVQDPTSHNPFLKDLSISTRIKDRMDALIEQVRMQNTLEEVIRDLGWINQSTPRAAIEQSINRLRANLRFQLVGGEIVEITYRAPKSADMDKVLEAVSRFFVKQLLAPAQTAVDGSETFLKDQLSEKRHELMLAEDTLARFKSDNADTLPGLHSRNVDRLAEIRRQLAEKRSQLAGNRGQFESIKLRLVETDPVVGQLERKLTTARANLSVLRARYTDNHSKVVAITREIDQLELERADRITAGRDLLATDTDRLWNMVSSGQGKELGLVVSQLERLQDARNQVERIAEEIEALDREEAILATRVNAFGHVEQRLSTLDRDVLTRRKIVSQLAERFEMAQVTSSLGRFGTSETVKVVNPPVIPKARSGYSLPVYAILGLFAGIAMGFGLALVIDLADPTVRRIEQIESSSGLRVLTRIPRIDGAPVSRAVKPGIFSILRRSGAQT